MSFAEFMSEYFSPADLVGYLACVFSIASMQAKKMRYVVILQCIANLVVVIQYAMTGQMSASGICIIGTVETLAIFLYNLKGRKFPLYLTAAFMLAGLALSAIMIGVNGWNDNIALDIIPAVALIAFNISMVQSRSSVARVFGLSNGLLWLGYNIITLEESMIIMYAICSTLTVIGIIRLDREDWKSAFNKIFKAKEDK